MRMPLSFMLFLTGCFALLLAPDPATATIEWVVIGDPGNAADSQPQGSYGAVGYEYSISKFETTNAEYVDFLNAKAASDPLGLYSPSMGSHAHGGILRMGSSGNYTYAAKAGFGNEAVNFVTFFDSLRFANWVNNGEGNGDTETGSYTLLGGTETPSNGSTVLRNPGAGVVLPNQDEWFKAAYYDPAIQTYYDYPMGSDDQPNCTSPTATPNSANCGDSTQRGVTVVGAYTGSPSPYGTFDQGGNVAESNENIVFAGGRANRGGGWTGLWTPLKASSVGSWLPEFDSEARGFRLALLGEPGGGSMDITEIGVFKLIERFDGTLSNNPYQFEACVSGTGITSATVTPPGAGPIPLFSAYDGEYCFSVGFENSAGLDQAFPNGMYEFVIFGAGSPDSKTLDLQASEPGGYLEIVNPPEGANVPDDQDLNYTWVLVEKSNGVGCIAGMSCGDGIFADIEKFGMTGNTLIVDEQLPISATGVLVPAADLSLDHFYDSGIETYTGTPNFNDMTDMGDPTVTAALYEDINHGFFTTEVPEPAAGLLGIAALLTVAAVSRGRVGKI